MSLTKKQIQKLREFAWKKPMSADTYFIPDAQITKEGWTVALTVNQ